MKLARALLVAFVTVVATAACIPADPTPTTTTTTATTSATATAAAPPAFAGDLRTLIATAPANRNAVPPQGAEDGQASLAVLVRLFTGPSPAPLEQRLGELGFRRAAVGQWQLSQLNFFLVKVIQLADETAARQWTSEQRQVWAGRPQDTETFKALNLPADFDNGAHGGWFVAVPAANSEVGNVRTVSAVFYRHDIVVHLDFTGPTDSHVAAVAAFADEQFAKLP